MEVDYVRMVTKRNQHRTSESSPIYYVPVWDGTSHPSHLDHYQLPTHTIAGELSSIIYTTSILVDIIEQAKILVLRRGETKEIHLVNR